MDMSLFEIQEGNYTDGGGRNCITRTTKVTGKGQVYFINKLVKQERENKIV
jgi:anti-repressor protein